MTKINCFMADHSVTKTAPATVQKGNPITYIIKASNAGPYTPTQVVATDVLPAGLTVISAPGCKIVGTTILCSAGTVLPGKSRSFTITAGTAGVACDTSVSNTVTIDSTLSLDPNESNNSSTAVTQVLCGQPIENELTITQQSTPSADTAVKNQKGVLLSRYIARAENETIFLQSMIFEAAQGTLLNGTNYSWFADTNADGVAETLVKGGVNPVSGRVTFSSNMQISAGQSMMFEIRADIPLSTTSNVLQLKLATADAGYVTAEDAVGADLNGVKLNGVCATTCEMTVTTVPSTIWTLYSQGDLFITKSVIPVRSRQLVGGTLGDEILRLTLRAQYENIDVTKLVFTADGANAGSIGSNVDRLELFRAGEATPFAFATRVGCGSDAVPANSLCAVLDAQQLIVPKSMDVTLLVRPRMRADTESAVSGQNVKFNVDAVAGAQARGFSSSNMLSMNDGDAVSEGEIFIGTSVPAASQTIMGNSNVVVMSKVLSITNADPNANGSPIPTGTRAIGQFKFSAAAQSNFQNGPNSWTLSDIIFNVNTTNVATDTTSYKIYNSADASQKAPCTVTSVSAAALLVTCADLTLSSVDTQVPTASDATFVLETMVTNPRISGSSSSTLQVSLQNFNDINASSFGTATSHLRWNDKDFGSSTQFLWSESADAVINGTSYEG